MPTTRIPGPVRVRAATLALVAVLSVGLASCDHTNPYQRGPAPTVASLEASRGPFATAQTTVPRTSVSAFGGGTITYPTDTSQGTFGAVAISPGYTGTQSSIAWLGPRIGSHGFVVITIDTLSPYDFSASRGDQLRAALDYLVNRSTVRGRIDRSRLAVMGHSMGGGGSLEATADDPAIQASIPLAPWNSTKNWSSVRTPTLIIGGENDTIAPVSSHSEPFYESLPASLDKAYLEINNGDHFFPNAPNTLTGKYSVAWLKRFVDNDTRYEQFLCGAPHRTDLSSGAIQEYRDTCPYS